MSRRIGVEFCQQLGGVGAQRVQEAKSVGAGHGDHRLANEVGQYPERIVAALFPSNDCRGVEVELCGKHGQAREEPTLMIVE